MNAFRQQTKPDARLHGVILDGGVAPKYHSGLYKSTGICKSSKDGIRKRTLRETYRLCERCGTRNRMHIRTFGTGSAFKDTCSNRYLSRMVATNLETLEHDVMHIDAKTVIPGSSDLGDVSYHCPAVQLTCGMSPKGDKTYYAPHTERICRTCLQRYRNRQCT